MDLSNKKIKTEGFTKEDEEKFQKLRRDQAEFNNLIELEEELKLSDQQAFSRERDRIIEGHTSPGELLDSRAIRGDVRAYAYPKLSRYMQIIREKFMKDAFIGNGREDRLPGYLGRFTKRMKGE